MNEAGLRKVIHEMNTNSLQGAAAKNNNGYNHHLNLFSVPFPLYTDTSVLSSVATTSTQDSAGLFMPGGTMYSLLSWLTGGSCLYKWSQGEP